MLCYTAWIRFFFVVVVGVAATSQLTTAATLPNLRFLPGVFFVPPQPPNPVFENVEISTGNSSGVVLSPNEDCICSIGSVGNTAPPLPPILPTTTIAPGDVVELGSGVIPTHIKNNGYAAVGSVHSIGDLTVQGDFTLEEGAYLYFDVGGTDPGEYDLIREYRQFAMSGTIRIIFRNGYAPQTNEIVPLVHFPESLSIAMYNLSPEKFQFANITSSPTIQIWIQDNLLGLKFFNNTTFVPEPSGTSIASFVVALCITSRRRS